MEETMEKKLIEYIKDFQLADLFGFARIVGAQEQEDFEDYVTEVVMKYLELPRKDRRNLLKIAKQISENNREYDTIYIGREWARRAFAPGFQIGF